MPLNWFQKWDFFDFQLMFVYKCRHDFLVQGLCLTFYFSCWVGEFEKIDLFSFAGITIFRGCLKSYFVDKSLYVNSCFYIKICLINFLRVAIVSFSFSSGIKLKFYQIRSWIENWMNQNCHVFDNIDSSRFPPKPLTIISYEDVVLKLFLK